MNSSGIFLSKVSSQQFSNYRNTIRLSTAHRQRVIVRFLGELISLSNLVQFWKIVLLEFRKEKKKLFVASIQNELISFMGNKVTITVIDTRRSWLKPTAATTESVILRFVATTNLDVEIWGHVIINEVVGNTKGKGLFWRDRGSFSCWRPGDAWLPW